MLFTRTHLEFQISFVTSADFRSRIHVGRTRTQVKDLYLERYRLDLVRQGCPYESIERACKAQRQFVTDGPPMDPHRKYTQQIKTKKMGIPKQKKDGEMPIISKSIFGAHLSPIPNPLGWDNLITM